jgi:hypothetical protein
MVMPLDTRSSELTYSPYHSAWNAVRGPTLKLINDNIKGPYANYNLFSTGGSLGGALAALAFAEFRTNTALGLSAKTTRGYSFGQPRTGNFAFAKWFNGKSGASPSQVGDFIRVTHGYGKTFSPHLH